MSRTTVRSGQVRDESLLVDDLKDFAPEAGAGLNLTVFAGRIRDNNVITEQSDQSILLTASSTNYVEINNVGTATFNTTGFTSGKIPVAIVTTNGSTILTITDKRAWVSFDNASGGSSTPSFSRNFLTMGA